MSTWYRVFGGQAAEPNPVALLEHLQAAAPELQARFRGDDHGWFQAELSYQGAVFELDRYLSSEDGIRALLNTWAAWMETHETNPDHGRLMQDMITTVQLFTLEVPDDPGAQALALAACRFLARATAGVYQVDQQGFFSADGTLLLPEDTLFKP